MERETAPGREQFGTHLGESQLEHSRTHLDWTRPEFRAGSREPTRTVHKLPARPFPTKKLAPVPQRRYRTLPTTIVRLVVNVPSAWPADRCTLPFSVSTAATHRPVRGTVTPPPTLTASPITPSSVPTRIMPVPPNTSSPPAWAATDAGNRTRRVASRTATPAETGKGTLLAEFSGSTVSPPSRNGPMLAGWQEGGLAHGMIVLRKSSEAAQTGVGSR